MRVVYIFSVAFAFAFLLAGRFDLEALATGIGLAVLACLWWGLLRSASRRRVAVPPGGAVSAWARALAALPGDTVRVGAALARALAGGGSPWRAVAAPFRFGEEDDPREAGRRAVAVTAGSLTPDRIVVDVKPGRATADTHRLAGGSDGDPAWLT